MMKDSELQRIAAASLKMCDEKSRHDGNTFHHGGDPSPKATAMQQEAAPSAIKDDVADKNGTKALGPRPLPELPIRRGLRFYNSQNELRTTYRSSVAPLPARKRRASFDSTVELVAAHAGDDMGARSVADLRQAIEDKQKAYEETTLSEFWEQHADAREVVLQDRYDKLKQRLAARGASELLIAPLFRSPLAGKHNARKTAIGQYAWESSGHESSSVDSSYLLDVLTQSKAMEAAWQEQTPAPFKSGHLRRQTHAAPSESHSRKKIQTFCPYIQEPEDPFTDRPRGYQRFAGSQASNVSQPGGGHHKVSGPALCCSLPVQKQEVSRALRRNDNEYKRIKNIVLSFSPDSSDTGNGGNNAGEPNQELGSQSQASRDDWVTEASGDQFRDSGAECTAPKDYGSKQTGSSLADVSDADADEFGLQQESAEPTATLGKTKSPKFHGYKSRIQDTIAESANNAATSLRAPRRFKPHRLAKKPSHPDEELEAGQELPPRTHFDVDDEEPPRFKFRDSISEYEGSVASFKDNMGTRANSPSGRRAGTGARAASYAGAAGCQAVVHDPQHRARYGSSLEPQPNPDSIYAAERQRARQELAERDFADSASFHENESAEGEASSASQPQTMFEFELLPLPSARRRNRYQRMTGQSNETSTGMARMPRPVIPGFESSHAAISPPSPAIITHRNLSINFSPGAYWNNEPADVERGGSNARGDRRRERRRTPHWLRGRDPMESAYANSSSGRRPLIENPYSNHQLYYTRNSPPRDGATHPAVGLLEDENETISARAKAARLRLFWGFVLLSALPFMTVLVLAGKFAELFKWATHGETDRPSHKQRTVLKWLLFIELLVYVVCATTILTYFGLKNAGRL